MMMMMATQGLIKHSVIGLSYPFYSQCLSLASTQPTLMHRSTSSRLLHQSILSPFTSWLKSFSLMFRRKPEVAKISPEGQEPMRLPLPPPPALNSKLKESIGGGIDPQESAAELISVLKARGHLSFIAGGWVRDRFMGVRAHDVDICSSATIADLKAAFGQSKVAALHVNTARVSFGREKFEVTRFKGFKKEPSGLSAFLDAKKRDFTINSLLYDPIERVVLDYCGGVEDIQKRILRMNRVPLICADDLTVLQEDPVRLVRGVRFAVQFGLEIHPTTLGHMRDCCIKATVEGPLHFALSLEDIRSLGSAHLTQRDDYVPIRENRKATEQAGWQRIRTTFINKLGSRSGRVKSAPVPSKEPQVVHVPGLYPEAKAGRIWRELTKIAMLDERHYDSPPSTRGSNSIPPFAQALYLFRHICLLPLLFPFLKGAQSSEAHRCCSVHREHLPNILTSMSCSSETLPLELRVLGLMDPFEPGSPDLMRKVAAMIQGVKDAMKYTPRGSPDMELVDLYLEAVMAARALISQGNSKVSPHKDVWIKLLSHDRSEQIVAIMMAWLRLEGEERKGAKRGPRAQQKGRDVQLQGQKGRDVQLQGFIEDIRTRFKGELSMGRSGHQLSAK